MSNTTPTAAQIRLLRIVLAMGGDVVLHQGRVIGDRVHKASALRLIAAGYLVARRGTPTAPGPVRCDLEVTAAGCRAVNAADAADAWTALVAREAEEEAAAAAAEVVPSVVVPVCAACLGCIHTGADPDFAYVLVDHAGNCQAADHADNVGR